MCELFQDYPLCHTFFLVVQGYEGRVPSIFEFYFSFFIKRKHLLSIALTFFHIQDKIQ